MFIGWKLLKKTTFVPLAEMDIWSGRREDIDGSRETGSFVDSGNDNNGDTRKKGSFWRKVKDIVVG
jgi:yeast amino acid transporter